MTVVSPPIPSVDALLPFTHGHVPSFIPAGLTIHALGSVVFSGTKMWQFAGAVTAPREDDS
jgi:hypothetical protein